MGFFFSRLHSLVASAKARGTAQRASLRVSRPQGRGKVQNHCSWGPGDLTAPSLQGGRLCGCVPLTLGTLTAWRALGCQWEGQHQNPNFFRTVSQTLSIRRGILSPAERAFSDTCKLSVRVRDPARLCLHRWFSEEPFLPTGEMECPWPSACTCYMNRFLSAPLPGKCLVLFPNS